MPLVDFGCSLKVKAPKNSGEMQLELSYGRIITFQVVMAKRMPCKKCKKKCVWGEGVDGF